MAVTSVNKRLLQMVSPMMAEFRYEEWDAPRAIALNCNVVAATTPAPLGKLIYTLYWETKLGVDVTTAITRTRTGQVITGG